MRLHVWCKLYKKSALSFELKWHSYNERQALGAWASVSQTSSPAPHLSPASTLMGPRRHWPPCWSSSSASTLPPLPLCSGSCLSLDCSPVRYLHGQLPRLIQSVQISLPKSHLWEAYLKLQGLRILDSEAPLTAFFPSLSSFHSTYDPLVHYIIYFSIVSCLILLLEWKLHQGRVFFVLLFCINGSPMPRTVPWI